MGSVRERGPATAVVLPAGRRLPRSPIPGTLGTANCRMTPDPHTAHTAASARAFGFRTGGTAGGPFVRIPVLAPHPRSVRHHWRTVGGGQWSREEEDAARHWASETLKVGGAGRGQEGRGVSGKRDRDREGQGECGGRSGLRRGRVCSAPIAFHGNALPGDLMKQPGRGRWQVLSGEDKHDGLIPGGGLFTHLSIVNGMIKCLQQ